MRKVNINLSNLEPQYDCGHCGESNSTDLTINVSTIKNNALFLVVVFKNGYAETYCSERYYTSDINNNEISVPLWYKLTKTEKEVAIVEAYAEDKNGNLTVLDKSDKINLYFEGSISSNDVILDNDVNGLYKELVELEKQIDDRLDILAAQLTLTKIATDNANSKATAAENAVKAINTAADTANKAATAANNAKVNADNAVKAVNKAKEQAEQATQKANDAAELATNAVTLIKDAKNNADIALEAANKAKASADNAANASNTANEASVKVQKIANSIDSRIENALSGIDITPKIVSTIDGYIGYEGYDDILGLQVDYENKIFTRLAGAVDKTAGEDFNNFAMYGGRKRCTVAKDGTIKAFCGDTNYSDVGSSQDGQIMVYQPKFYYKVVPLKMDKITDGLGYHIRKANYYITNTPKAGFKLHPAFYDENGKEIDYILYSAYESAYWDSSLNVWFKDGTMTDTNIDYTRDSLWSLSSKKPISGAVKNLTKDNFELLAHNLGSGWHLETIKAVAANQLLMMIEFGTMNFQDVIGKGVVAFQSNATYNASSLTGSTKDLGNATGQAAKTINEIAGVETEYTEDGKVAVSYRGMENPWGNLYRLVNGLNIWGDGTMSGGQPYVADDFEFNASKHTDNYKPVGFVLPNGTGYISAMGYGSEEYDWLLMPSENKGNSSLPVGDYSDITSNVNDYRAIMHFGAWSNNLAAGVFDCICLYGPNSKSRTLGGRLVYIPTAE